MTLAALNLRQSWPEGYTALGAMGKAVHESGLEPGLIELIQVRASQLNSCAFCLDMHTKDARARGETEQRLYALSAWRETPFFSARERAALALTEAVTLVAESHVPEEVVEEAREVLGDADVTKALFAIIAINCWNRLMVTSRAPVGGYVSRVPQPVS